MCRYIYRCVYAHMYRIETVLFAKNRQLRQLLLPDLFGFPSSDAFAATTSRTFEVDRAVATKQKTSRTWCSLVFHLSGEE